MVGAGHVEGVDGAGVQSLPLHEHSHRPVRLSDTRGVRTTYSSDKHKGREGHGGDAYTTDTHCMGENLGGYVHDRHTLYGRESRGDTYTTDTHCMGENLGGIRTQRTHTVWERI